MSAVIQQGRIGIPVRRRTWTSQKRKRATLKQFAAMSCITLAMMFVIKISLGFLGFMAIEGARLAATDANQRAMRAESDVQRLDARLRQARLSSNVTKWANANEFTRSVTESNEIIAISTGE